MDNNAQDPAQTPQQTDTTVFKTEAQDSPAEPASLSKPPKKKRSIIKIIFIVLGVLFLLLVLLGAAAFYYLQSQGLTPDKLNPEPQSPQTTIAPRNNNTNTYQNQNYKFSVPIDKEVKVKPTSHGFGVTSIELSSPESSDEENTADFQMLVFPKALGAAINQDFDKYYNMPDNTSQEIKDPSGAAVQFTKVRNRTVNNNRAFEFSSTASPVDPEVEPEIGVYIEMGTDTLVISTAESNRGKLEEMLKDFKYPL